MIGGAILGGLIGLVIVLIMNNMRAGKFKELQRSLSDKKIDHIIPAYYASAQRFKKKLKIYDSFGAFYISGNKAVYVTDGQNEEFDLSEPGIQVKNEGRWRNLNWFSITSPIGNPYYFTSFKPGAFKNDSTAAAATCEKLVALLAESRQQ